MGVSGMSEAARTLLVMRHAKSAYPPGVADHDRPLAPRGVREARLAGDWLRANADVDAVLCSTATRARETLGATKIKASTRYLERLYDGSAGIVIDEINGTEDAIRTLLLIGHQPTMGELVLGLNGADGSNPEAVEAVVAKFPTSAIAVLHTGEPWRRLELGGAALVGFHVPR
jgi:phosphohistidine phosphatase